MQLNKLAEKYPDGDEQKSIIKLLESISWVTDKAFTELYNLYHSNATLKIQVEILKEILLSIPEVKNNENFMRVYEKRRYRPLTNQLIGSNG